MSNDLIPDPELLAETEAGVYGDEFENFEPYIAMKKIIKAIGFDGFMFRANTSMPFKSQWWRGFDDVYELNEEEMNELIPQIVSPTEGADVSGTYKFDSVETRALA